MTALFPSLPFPIPHTHIRPLAERFSGKSDTWAYGVLVWEIFSNAKEPYGDWDGRKTFNMVQSGHRLDAPRGTPAVFQSIMSDCWSSNPSRRPTFRRLVQCLEALRRNDWPAGGAEELRRLRQSDDENEERRRPIAK